MNRTELNILFQSKFDHEADILVKSPGRINIIG